MKNEAGVTRRELVELGFRSAAVPGAAAFFAAWVRAGEGDDHPAGHAPPPDPELLRHYRPQFFKPEDFQALEAFTEILIPTDSTPGAKEAHCALFLDFLLHSSDGMPETQLAWRHAMSALQATGFHTADAARRLELMREMSRPETDHRAHHAAFPAYRLIKRHTAFAFFTSREGMIETLDYKGESAHAVFPPCSHPEHQTI